MKQILRRHKTPAVQSPPRLTKNEEALLEQIACEITASERRRYEALQEKFEAVTLTDDEYEEFLALSDKIEGAEVKRLEYVALLARQRNLPLLEFMQLCGIKSPSYA